MAPERRKQVITVAAALVALAAATYYAWPRPSAAVRPASNQRAGEAPTARTAPGVQAPDVHLPALQAERPKPGTAERNLFRFRSRPAPPPPSSSSSKIEAPPPFTGPTGPPPPPAVPPIMLKFIGFVDEGGGKKIAALKDTADNVFHGREGAVIEGRYRILHIGVESIEMSYLDGTGRRMIRLSGS